MTTRMLYIISISLNITIVCWWLVTTMLVNTTHPTVPAAVIRHAVGIAYCSPVNADKHADFELINTIVNQVERESNSWLRRWWR